MLSVFGSVHEVFGFIVGIAADYLRFGSEGDCGAVADAEGALDFGMAFGFFCSQRSDGRSQKEEPKVAVGRDSRPSGMMVLNALAAGLMAVGVDVVEVGVATTPSVALLGRFLKTDASIVITASHNPIEWNGIKFLRGWDCVSAGVGGGD